MTHECTQKQVIEKMNEKIASQKILAEETFAKVNDVQDSLENQIAHQAKYERDLSVFILEATATMKIVDDKIIPAYEREANAENAKKWIKEQAKSGSFWIGVAMSILGLFWAVIAVIRQSVK